MKNFNNIKQIEHMNESEDILSEIKYQNELFDLTSFYLNDEDSALAVITPKQAIYVYAIFSHEYVCEKVYNQLYPDFTWLSGKDIDDSNETTCWQEMATNQGNIIIQFDSNDDSLVWFPEHINMYQYTELCRIHKQLQFILPKLVNHDVAFVGIHGRFPSFEPMVEYAKGKIDLHFLGIEEERILINTDIKRK